VVGKLVTKEDADQLVRDAYALEARGLTPIAAEQQAVRDALDEAIRNGEEVLRQVQLQRPQAYQQARNFWEKETIRKAGMVPPPLPRFITGPAVPADEIVTSHNTQGGSTINAVHGDLAYSNSFSVSIFPDLTTPVPGNLITPEQIHAFAAKLQAAGIDPRSPNVSIGTWYDTETNTTFLDVAFTTRDREVAVVLGTQFNQKAIFDLNVMEEIPLGGTGLALERLPSVQERLGIMSSLSYVPPDARTAQETVAGAPGAPAPAPEGVAGGAQGGVSETGSVQEESQPDQVAGPISEGAQAVVDSLPQEQRAAAQKAFARDDRNPLADEQRRLGQPVSVRKDKSIAPEKNTKLIAELSKYDFGKSVAESLQAFASDPQQPRWVRLIADLFTQLGLGENVNIRAVNSPEASWGALYVRNKETGKGEILINMTAKGPDLARRVLHELAHHGTLTKLTGEERNLTVAELAAKRELQKIFDYVKSNRGAFGPEATRYGAATALHEFISEIFANPQLRTKLNSIRPDGKVSLMQRFTDAVLKLLIGDRAAIMRPGSMLENAIRQAINVAGSPSVETSPQTIAAMHEQRARAAREANEYPNFQEEIANLVAPMADNMGISKADQIADDLDHESAFYSKEERTAIEADVDRMAKGIGATKAEIKDVKNRVEAYIKYYRAKHPTKTGWANSAIKALGLQEKDGLTRGKVDKTNPSGINFKVKFAKSPYTFARDAANKLIPRFLRQSRAEAAAGQPLVENPEWAKRRQELGDKMFDNLQQIMARRKEGGEAGRVAQVILDQINWYRDMMTHLRVTFGSMSDYVADVIAGLSPITDVPGNWANFLEYFEGVMKGRYDDLYRKFDAYVSEDPENRNASTWREAGGEMPLKLNKAKFGTNGPNVMMAGLDLWRAVQTGTAPKARNFGLNLIGLSLRATIDRWAGRYLQRMHAPTWRLPPMIEADVKGEHMPGENVNLVSGDFGMGQDVFEDVAQRLRESSMPEFRNVTAADLQAILWFAEKQVWELRKWTQIMGAGSSMNALAQATAAQRYETGTLPGATAAEKRLMGETIGLRNKINGEQHVLGAKMVPSVNIHNGEESKTFDGDWITHPEYDPENSIGHVAEAAARLGTDAAHISRVIVNPYEVNDQMTPGLHIFFRERVGDPEIKGVLDKLKAAGITNGITLSVDPRVRPEIIKSLDPETGANQYNGVRVQYVPGYYEGGMTRDQIEEAFADVRVALAKDASIAESRVLYYDALVLRKGTDYDSSGKLTEDFRDNRAQAWTERARLEGSAATTRRDDVRRAIKDRERQDRELERRIEREEQERIARFEEFRQRIQPPDRANDGGVDPPSVAAMQLEDETEPARDPHGGRASLVRAMVDRITGASRNREGIEVPESQQEVRGLAPAGSGANPGRKGSAPLWRTLGGTFRQREAELYGRIENAAQLIRAANPENPENPRDPAKYENSQKLLDYLTGKETPTDPELQAQIAELRKEIPVIPGKNIPGDHLDSGVEADVFYDPSGGVVHKLYGINNGVVGKRGGVSSYVPGRLSLGADKEIRVAAGARPTISDLLGRMERSNSQGALTPHELSGITPDGRLVFTSPFVEGREVSQKNMRGALARAGVHLLTEMGGTSGVAKLDDGRWVLYDDLHPGNVRTMPGGRVEIVDANNRELDPHEVADLTQLEKMPLDKPLGTPPGRPVRDILSAEEVPKTPFIQYLTDITEGKPVETYHGSPRRGISELKPGSSFTTSRQLAEKIAGKSGEVYTRQLIIPPDNPIRWSAELFLKDIESGKITPEEAERAFRARPSEVKEKAPVVEPVTVAPMVEEEVKDGIDLSIAPMAGRGSRARWPWHGLGQEKVAGYKPGGIWSPQAQLSRPIGYALQEHKAEKGAIMARAKYLVRELEGAMKRGFGGKPTPDQLKDVQVALGNIDNRLSQAQYNQALKIRDTTARETFVRQEHQNNVAAFKTRQQAALAGLPEGVRDSVIEMRKALDEQMQELLRDPGIDADLKARISADQGVFLHSNSYQHFENDVWGKYISKSNDPEAQRIRRAAENLFKNEVTAELAQAYQVANPGVSDADALRIVSSSGDIPQMAKTRLAAYLRKDADEITRIHMLTGKMPVARNQEGKMLSLQRESMPKEVRELWGQWDEPKANFVKTYSLLANHNAENRVQAKVLAEGTVQGYIWKRGDPTPLPADLVPLWKSGEHGPLKDAYGPQLLKDGMSNYNHPAVQQLWTGLNRLALMSKTVGSIGSAVHNLLGNVAFTVTNGNLPWAVAYMPKGVFVTLIKGMEGVLPITPSKNAREEQIEMIRLGIFDSDVTFEQSQEIYHAMEVGAALEKKMGTAGAVYGALQTLGKPVRVTARAFKNFYIAQDNFWKYINYRTELSKQQWFNKDNPTPPGEEEMKQRAARMVQDTLPNRERVAEWVRRGVGSESTLGQFVGPFFTFPLEAGRTVANNVYHTSRELVSPHTNAKEKTFATWRVAGMLLTLSAPWLITALSKWMNGYTDDDEEALRASLPEYRKDASYLIMMPRDENGMPQYLDLSFLNPYGYYHSSVIAAGRALQEKSASIPEAGGKLALSALKPLYTTQPGIGTVMDIARNSDSLRGGAPVYNPEKSWHDTAMDISSRIVKGLAPGTAQSLYRNYLASQDYIDPKSGRPFEVRRELESLVGMPHLESFEPDKAMASAVGTYKKRMSNAMQILNEKTGAKGTVASGEVTAAYQQANKQAFEIFAEMNKAYANMLQLGMSKKDARQAMEIGFGTEIRKGGLSKNKIENIIRGKFFPVEISDQMEKEIRRNFPERWQEYRAALRAAEKRYIE
jgi:hypothetical protein